MKYLESGYLCNIDAYVKGYTAQIRVAPSPDKDMAESIEELRQEFISYDDLQVLTFDVNDKPSDNISDVEYIIIRCKTLHNLQQTKQIVADILIKTAKDKEVYPYITYDDIEDLMDDFYKGHQDALDVLLNAEMYDFNEEIPYEIEPNDILEIIQEGIINNLCAESPDFNFESYVEDKIEEYCNGLENDSGRMGPIIDSYKESIEWDHADRDLDR